jgi:hypothetical protein
MDGGANFFISRYALAGVRIEQNERAKSWLKLMTYEPTIRVLGYIHLRLLAAHRL